jgi:hypothetical protein
MQKKFRLPLVMLFVALFVSVTNSTQAQFFKPRAIAAGYLGETIAHPGIKIGGHWSIVEWNKNLKNSNEITRLRGLYLCPSIGFFHHRHYQTSIVTSVELTYLRRTKRNNFFSLFLGGGMMNSFIPNVYELNNGSVEKVGYHSNYWTSSFGVAFGKNVRKKSEKPLDIFIKPSFMQAKPSASGGVWYFMTELGILYRL